MKRIFALAASACVFSATTFAADIVDTAVSAGNFTTLVKLVQSAGLVDTLKGPGPFTVFAPTDAAFAKVPAATMEALGKDPQALKKVLTYHVVSGKVMSSEVKSGPVNTVAGVPAKVTAKGGKVMIDQANVIKADIVTDNGVIHVIDSVILPK